MLLSWRRRGFCKTGDKGYPVVVFNINVKEEKVVFSNYCNKIRNAFAYFAKVNTVAGV